jgi:hypothetical protein
VTVSPIRYMPPGRLPTVRRDTPWVELRGRSVSPGFQLLPALVCRRQLLLERGQAGLGVHHLVSPLLISGRIDQDPVQAALFGL